mgnify:CR=1 FL=1
MFAKEYLYIVSRWAGDQLRSGAPTADQRCRLERLIEAANALGADLTVATEAPQNVISLDAYRRHAS